MLGPGLGRRTRSTPPPRAAPARSAPRPARASGRPNRAPLRGGQAARAHRVAIQTARSRTAACSSAPVPAEVLVAHQHEALAEPLARARPPAASSRSTGRAGRPALPLARRAAWECRSGDPTSRAASCCACTPCRARGARRARTAARGSARSAGAGTRASWAPSIPTTGAVGRLGAGPVRDRSRARRRADSTHGRAPARGRSRCPPGAHSRPGRSGGRACSARTCRAGGGCGRRRPATTTAGA